jgi:DNA-binding transcriptional MerR regulator
VTDNQKTWTISQLAEEFSIAPSKIRYYEQKNLISPRRSSGQQRIFDKHDRTRLKLILRGSRVGLSLEQISEIIGLNTDQLPEVEQTRRALDYIIQIKEDLQKKKQEIITMEAEVDSYIAGMQDRLIALEEENV